MKSQKSDNDGNITKASDSQAPKAKVVADIHQSKVEKAVNPNSSALPIGRKKGGKRIQSQSDHKISEPEEELRDQIAKRAYELYEQRGWHHGSDREDWFRAEKDVLTQKERGKRRDMAVEIHN